MGGLTSKCDKVTQNVSWKIAKADNEALRPVYNEIDQFGFSPSPRFAGSDHKSVFGAVLSLGVFGLLLYYIVTTAQRFQDFNPVVTSSLRAVDGNDELPLGPVDISAGESGVDWAVVFRPQPLNATFNDTRYGTFAVSLVTVNEQDLLPRDRIYLPMQACSFAARHPDLHIGWLGSNAFCPQQVVRVSGSYATPKYSFLQVDFVRCDRAVRTDCVDEEELWRVLSSARINFMFVQTDFAHNRYLTPLKQYETTYYFFARGLWTLSEVFFRKKAITVLPDLVYRSETVEAETFRFEREKSYVNDGNTTFVGTRLATFFIRFDTTLNEELWNVQTILDLLGSWSAFFGTLSVTIGAVALWQNRTNFYARHKAWDEFDENFRSKYATLHVSQAVELPPSNFGGGGSSSSPRDAAGSLSPDHASVVALRAQAAEQQGAVRE